MFFQMWINFAFLKVENIRVLYIDTNQSIYYIQVVMAPKLKDG